MLRPLLVICIALASFASSADDYPRDLFAVTQLHINAVRQPQGLESLFIARDSRQVQSSVSRYMGIRNEFVALSSVRPTAEVKGEDTFYDLPLPDGYVVCAARVYVTSIAPGSGKRASVFNVNIRKNAIGAYTWTQRPRPFDGRSWVEADIQLLGILEKFKDEFQEKKVCGNDFQRELSLVSCSGNPCPPSKFGQLEIAGSHTPSMRILPTISWGAKSSDPDTWTAASRPVQFASPPVPNLDGLKKCKQNALSQNEFFSCMTESALPKEYRVVKECINKNQADHARAAVCSIGRKDLLQAYDRALEVHRCARDADDDGDVALCLGTQILGRRELHYARCLNNNRTDYIQAAVCGLSQDLSPEQQIAISCAMKTGMNPKAYAACTGGQLLEREVNKCWANGIGTETGCFGPNNELRRYVNSVDGTVKQTLGESNDLYKLFKRYKDDVLAPGPTHDFIKAINTAQRDLKHGPGENNDLVKVSNAVGGMAQSVGETVGGMFGF